tara:strand:- start:4173 stop:5135 length:963 start_codon:yes stop_codon:yes gene_type:complete
MKKIILHVGYPKTGTTSFQNGLFLNLNDKINYLGIAKAPISEHHHFLRKALRPWLTTKGHEGKEELNLLFNDRLSSGTNLLSEESFINSRNKPGPLIEPSEIKKLFELKCDLIEVVIVIRNQADLIYALYANGGILDKYGNIQNNDSYIDKCLNDKIYRPFFNFAGVIEKYKIIFGDSKVHVLFFEDFLFDKEKYFEEWAKILSISKERLLETMGESHLHKKQKASDGSYILKRKIEPNKIKHVIKSIPFMHNIFSRLSVFKIVKNISLSANKRVDKELKIKLFSDEEKHRIKKSFFQDNLMLLKVIKSNKEKLKKYNYL